MRTIANLIFLIIFTIPSITFSALLVGIGKEEITPPIGTPSAGYTDRKGAGMEGVLDPLLAIALFIDNGDKKIVLCSVDHLGFTYEMAEQVIKKAQKETNAEIFIASSHTHSGGGSYLNIPFLGEALAGPYKPEIEQFYIEQTAKAIIQASKNPVLAKIGIGYGQAEHLSTYRGLWPVGISPLSDVAVIKVTTPDDIPLAVFFNYPVHPTILKSQNRLFSADFVGSAREHLQSLLGKTIQPLYFNGAQGEILPALDSCDALGASLAKTVQSIWNTIQAKDSLSINTLKTNYVFEPQKTPFGLALPSKPYSSEINLLVLDTHHAFITIPGELSCLYDQSLKKTAKTLGYKHLSIFGLTNDAHGYIISPDAWEHKTQESGLSFGGALYGDFVESTAINLLKKGSS